ncbi:MAG TPA: aminotransferase class V-fold PLP-dependent enzyme [Anaerolineaceae bacterium]|nr:aminotransferase class V-fold PLP-dependent enzyme [Anaerolineaceae bacterium]
MDITALRAEFPVTDHVIYLNNAAESPLNNRVRQRLADYLILASEAPHKKPSVRHAVKAMLSDLFGGAADEYALVTSTGVGVSIVAAGYPWKPGDNVVLPADQHWNNTFPWLALRQRGVDVRLVPVDPDYRVNPQAIADRVDKNTRILATAAVEFNTGFRADLKQLSQIAHQAGALFMVDGIQAAGVCPLNIDADGIDILAAAGFKWLFGMPGTGFLYVNRRAQDLIQPVMPGMFAADNNHTRDLLYFPDARRYETGTIAYSHFHSWTAGLELLKELGIVNIHARVLHLTDYLIAGLRARNIKITSPVEHIAERSAILSLTIGSPQENQALYEKLFAQDIIVAPRDGRIRVSPNFFNTEAEIDRLLQAL